MSNLLNIEEAQFKDVVLDSTVPVLIDFWATWCQPCLMLAPVLEEVSEHYGEKVKVVKIDVDNNPNIARQFGVRSIPNMFIIKNGKAVENIVGLKSKSELTQYLDAHL